MKFFKKGFSLKKFQFKFAKKTLWLIFLLLFLLTLLILQFLYREQLKEIKNPFVKTSVLSLYISKDNISGQEKLSLKLKVEEKDKAEVEQFLNKLGTPQLLTDEVSLTLDSKSIDYLKEVIPTDLVLTVSGNTTSFKSLGTSTLLTSSPKDSFEIATGSSKLKFKKDNERDFSLEVLGPKEVLNYSTSSGTIYLSPKINEGLFSIFSKVAKINLRVKNRNIEGSIELTN